MTISKGLLSLDLILHFGFLCQIIDFTPWHQITVSLLGVTEPSTLCDQHHISLLRVTESERRCMLALKYTKTAFSTVVPSISARSKSSHNNESKSIVPVTESHCCCRSAWRYIATSCSRIVSSSSASTTLVCGALPRIYQGITCCLQLVHQLLDNSKSTLM